LTAETKYGGTITITNVKRKRVPGAAIQWTDRRTKHAGSTIYKSNQLNDDNRKDRYILRKFLVHVSSTLLPDL